MEWDIETNSLRNNILHFPSLYIGHELNADGFHFLVLEIVRLAVQPKSVNECSALDITIEQTGEFSIIDNGRGLPVTAIRLWNSPQKPKIEHVLTWIWERHPKRQYYEEFGFLNYLGAVLAALSARLRIETNFEGQLYSLTCAYGKIIKPLQKIRQSNNRGTQITFVPDPEIFSSLIFNDNIIIEKLQQLAIEYSHLQFTFYNKQSGRKIKIPIM